MGAAVALAPEWTARQLVDRAFTTRPRRFRLPDGAARTLTTARGAPFVAYTYGEGPNVYVQHGWDGSAGDFAALVPMLVDRGFRVVAVDAPGHGAAPGRRSNLVVLAEALGAAVAAEGPAHALIGHSLGATAVGLASADGVRAERAVLLAPFLDPRDYFGPLGALGGPRLRDLVYATTERVAGRKLAHIGLHTTVDALPDRVLVVHDRTDRQVPFGGIAAFAASHPGIDARWTDGLGHRRLLADPAVVSAVARFVAGEAPRACGHGSVREICEECALESALYAPHGRF